MVAAGVGARMGVVGPWVGLRVLVGPSVSVVGAETRDRADSSFGKQRVWVTAISLRTMLCRVYRFNQF